MTLRPFHWLLAAVLSSTPWTVSATYAQQPVPPTPAAPSITLTAPPADVVERAVEAQFELALSPDGEGALIAPRIRIIGSGDGGGGAFYFSSPIEDTTSSLVQSDAVQKELELLAAQKEQIRKLYETMHADSRKLMEESARSSKDSPDARPMPSRDLPKRMQAIRDETQKKVQDVLLPHQQKRLSQISLRTKMKNRGTVGTLSGDLAKDLEITDAQKERLKKRAQQVQEDLEKKIAKLREEAREEIIEELTPAQREKLKDLLGDEFDPQPQPRRVIKSSSSSSNSSSPGSSSGSSSGSGGGSGSGGNFVPLK